MFQEKQKPRSRVAELALELPRAVAETVESYTPGAIMQNVGRRAYDALPDLEAGVEDWMNDGHTGVTPPGPLATPVQKTQGAVDPALTAPLTSRTTVTPNGTYDDTGKEIGASDVPMTDQERYPGLQSALPQKFTPAQTKQTAESLKGHDARRGMQSYAPELGINELPKDRMAADTALFDAPDDQMSGFGAAAAIMARDGQNDAIAHSNQAQVAAGEQASARGDFNRNYEANAMKQEAAMVEAQARMGFTEETGLPWDPQLGAIWLNAKKEQATDEQEAQAQAQLKKAYLSGDPRFGKEWYDKAMRNLALNFGARRHAPEGYFKAFTPKDDIAALLLNDPQAPVAAR